jgi:hypothetical protein
MKFNFQTLHYSSEANLFRLNFDHSNIRNEYISEKQNFLILAEWGEERHRILKNSEKSE